MRNYNKSLLLLLLIVFAQATTTSIKLNDKNLTDEIAKAKQAVENIKKLSESIKSTD